MDDTIRSLCGGASPANGLDRQRCQTASSS